MDPKTSEIRTRFAPSPTGQLHMGGARTALFSYLLAKKHGGKFLLRIEDTDQKRHDETSEQGIEEGLEWLGIAPDESPSRGGPTAPYRQSERLEIYRGYIEPLLDKDGGYYCFCTEETLAAMREEQLEKKLPPKYDGRCRSIPLEETRRRAATEPHVLRLKLPQTGELVINDLVRGNVRFHYKDLDDQVLIKSDGYPTYHFASVLDDVEMQITHVIRSDEWLPSTPKHVFLLNALGLPVPKYAHVPMVLNENKSKMSKRKDGEKVWLGYYRRLGYLPEAVVNFLALVGWNPKSSQEIFSLKELTEVFDLANVNKAGAVFDVKKLNHVSSHYMKELPRERFLEMARQFLTEKGMDVSRPMWEEAALLERDRLEYFAQIGESTAFFFHDEIELERSRLVWKKSTLEQAKDALEWVSGLLANDKGEWTVQRIEQWLLHEIQQAGRSNGEALFPLRYAITGQQFSPTPFECLYVLGKERALARIHHAISRLSESVL